MADPRLRVAFVSYADGSHDYTFMSALSGSVDAFWLHPGGRALADAPIPESRRAAVLPKDLSILPRLSQQRTVRKIRALMDEWRIDVVHALYAMPHAVWASLSGRPYIVTLHGSDIFRDARQFRSPRGPLQNLSFPLRRRVFGSAISNAFAVTGASFELLESAKHWGAEPSRLHIIRTGVVLETFSPPTPRPARPMREIVSLRKMAPLYNNMQILEGFSLLSKRFPDARMTMIDDRADPAYSARVKEQARELSLMDRCRFIAPLGPQALASLLWDSDLSVMAPATDGTPVTALECMAAGTPLVMGPAPYDSDLFSESTCWSTRETTPSAIASVMEEVMSAPHQTIRQKTAAAAERVARLADRKVEMSRMASLYRTGLAAAC